MNKDELIKAIKDYRADAINEYYKAIDNLSKEDSTAQDKEMSKRLSHIHYGRVEAFNEIINYLNKYYEG